MYCLYYSLSSILLLFVFLTTRTTSENEHFEQKKKKKYEKNGFFFVTNWFNRIIYVRKYRLGTENAIGADGGKLCGKRFEKSKTRSARGA